MRKTLTSTENLKMTKGTFGTAILLFFVTLSAAYAEDPVPSELIEKIVVKKVLSAKSARAGKISAPRKVLLCWSKPDHPKGTHGYEIFAKSMGMRLNRVDNVAARAVQGFPTKEQWADADLVIFFLTQNELSDAQYQQLDDHLQPGKSVMVLHQGLVQRKRYNDWADRVGFAFSWDGGEKGSKWGRFDNAITLDSTHEIFSGFPKSVTFKDEFYWNLHKGDRGTITILGETTAPGPKSEKKWPVFWTVEHPAGENTAGGRVFCAVIGHFNEITNDPLLRAIHLRAIAWCLNESFEPFKPLVMDRESAKGSNAASRPR
jgi:type 1 glutamine amidotransferase